MFINRIILKQMRIGKIVDNSCADTFVISMALWKLQWFIGSDELRFLEASMALSHVKNDGVLIQCSMKQDGHL